MPLSREQHQQLHELRQWARKQGETPASAPNAQNVQAEQARSVEARTFVDDVVTREHPIVELQAQVRASAPPQSGSPNGETPAPETTPEGSD
jgi:hypothetical protein